ncbi:hypothetical protein C8D03_4610 [Bosea sp. 124]|nr:hypothetical protein C8D03_4610 [Bosea sp. 124]
MHPAYTIARITPGQVDAAYLLAGPLAPALDLERWRSYCGQMLSGKGVTADQHDIAVAVNPLGYVQGLCIHGLARHVVHGTILDVPIFAVASAADGIGVAAALLQHLCTVAGRLDCAAIRIRTGGAEPWQRQLEDHTLTDGQIRIPVILNAAYALDVPWAGYQGADLPVKT